MEEASLTGEEIDMKCEVCQRRVGHEMELGRGGNITVDCYSCLEKIFLFLTICTWKHCGGGRSSGEGGDVRSGMIAKIEHGSDALMIRRWKQVDRMAKRARK